MFLKMYSITIIKGAKYHVPVVAALTKVQTILMSLMLTDASNVLS